MMTGLLHEQEFSRKTFVKGGGALVVGFSLAGSALAGRASAAAPTAAGYLPDVNEVDSWITIGADNTVTLKTSQIEVGNGITTGFLQVLAEELDLDMSQMYYGRFSSESQPHADSYVAVSTGGEGGSRAMSGPVQGVRSWATGTPSWAAAMPRSAWRASAPTFRIFEPVPDIAREPPSPPVLTAT